MSNIPSNLRYTKDHEWTLIGDDGTVTIGITEHAQEALGEIVYLELPTVGRELKKGDTLGVVESIKAVSDIYAPVAGKVVEAHSDLSADPSRINKDPYKDGWLLKVHVSDRSSLDGLMEAKAYADYVASLK